VPQLLYQIARTRSSELFLLTVVVLCFAIAWLTSSVGLSLALGAFLAGLIISESEYSYQALGSILPFRDVFTSFFFVSIGMLLDVGFLFESLPRVVTIVLIILTLKTLTAGFAAFLLGFPLRTALLVGLTLAQVGEFSFVLARSGVTQGFLAGDIYQLFLAVSVVTMAVTPFISSVAPYVTDSVMRLPIPSRLKSGLYPLEREKKASKNDHLVIIGFGVNGRNLNRAATVAGIPHVIVDMNPETVRQERKSGKPIFYGDATQETVLHHAGIHAARVVVVAISDAAATRRIIEIVRRLNPKVQVIARTRFLKEVKPLFELGANEVVPEEFETSVEIFTRVLRKYLIPRDEIEKLISEVRSDGYQMFRSLSKDSLSLSDLTLNIPDIEISTLRVCERSPVDGKSLAQVELRKRYGVSILAIRRGERVLSNPGADMQLLGNDVVVALGTPDKIAVAMGLFHALEGGKI
jgi:CPA2 family monovalent cation:H+ antiporter-2